MTIFAPLLALAAFAQGETPSANLELGASSGVVGRGIKATLVLNLPQGTHGYQNPPADEFENPIALSSGDKAFKLYKVAYPKGTDFSMDGAAKPTKVYEGTIRIPFILIPTAAGSPTASVKVDYQLCTASTCYPPSTLVVKAPLTVAPAPKKAKA